MNWNTGVRTSTVSADWEAWDIPFRLMVTNPWEIESASELIEGQFEALAEVAGSSFAGPIPDKALIRALGGGARPRHTASFPHGIISVPREVDAHWPAQTVRQPAMTSAACAREGWCCAGPLSTCALIAQRCAELVADASACGALVAFGHDVATSGPAPLGGWRIEMLSGSAAHSVVAVDGGAVSSTGSARAAHDDRGRSVVWRSVTVAAADAPTARTACSDAMEQGAAAPALLAENGLPAHLVDIAGVVHRVGAWPAAHELDRRAGQRDRARTDDTAR